MTRLSDPVDPADLSEGERVRIVVDGAVRVGGDAWTDDGAGWLILSRCAEVRRILPDPTPLTPGYVPQEWDEAVTDDGQVWTYWPKRDVWLTESAGRIGTRALAAQGATLRARGE